MPKFRKTNFNQHMFVPINLSAQLLPGTLESEINEVLDRIDISKFEQRFKNQETGAPAYNPRILLKIIFYAYSRGIISSRKIAEAADNHITFIALSGYSKPDFTTIANFASSMQEEITIVFLHVLRICNKMQLIGGERFAIDGHKLSGNASKEWSGTREALQKKLEKMKSMNDDEVNLTGNQVLADANYFREKNLEYLESEKIDAYIPDPMFRKRDSRFADADAHNGKTKRNIYDKTRNKDMRGLTQEDFTYHSDGDYLSAGRVAD